VSAEASPFDRLDSFIADGRLIRQQWVGTDAAGRETACLIAAIWPDAGRKRYAGACAAEVMPKWLALMTPWIDDAGSLEPWPIVIRRYAALARRWHALTSADWRAVEYRVRAITVREAMAHTKHEKIVAICERVAALCDRFAGGEAGLEWAAAAAAAAAADAAAAARWAAARWAADAADRMIFATLDAIESAIVVAEGRAA